MKPLIFKFTPSQEEGYVRFREKYKLYKCLDLYKELIIEKHLADNPKLYFSSKREKHRESFYSKHTSEKLEFTCGSWIVFDWKAQIMHLPNSDDLLELRTLRNRNLITSNEQKILYSKKISIVGLSVGSNVLLTLVRTGVGKFLRIADFDVVSILNMNRAHFFLDEINYPKVDVIACKVYEIDPYLKVEKFSSGISQENIEVFIKDSDLVIDAIDNFAVKILLRKASKKRKISVLSGFDIETGSMVILERYDLEPKLDLDFFLNGFSESEVLASHKSIKDKTNLFINIIGRKHHSQRMLDSVMNVGKELSGYPQLSIATNLTSALWTSVAVDVFLGRNNKSLRYYLNLN